MSLLFRNEDQPSESNKLASLNEDFNRFFEVEVLVQPVNLKLIDLVV
jgi:hypothetical protein